jgi:hypothetical protein
VPIKLPISRQIPATFTGFVMTELIAGPWMRYTAANNIVRVTWNWWSGADSPQSRPGGPHELLRISGDIVTEFRAVLAERRVLLATIAREWLDHNVGLLFRDGALGEATLGISLKYYDAHAIINALKGKQ